MNRNITVPANTSIHVTIFLHHCLHANGSGGMTQQEIQDMINVTYQDFLPHNIILEFEQCQETIRDDPNDPYFDKTDQQPFEVIAGKYACNSYGIDVFILPDDFLQTEQGGGGTVGGGTALTGAFQIVA